MTLLDAPTLYQFLTISRENCRTKAMFLSHKGQKRAKLIQRKHLILKAGYAVCISLFVGNTVNKTKAGRFLAVAPAL